MVLPQMTELMRFDKLLRSKLGLPENGGIRLQVVVAGTAFANAAVLTRYSVEGTWLVRWWVVAYGFVVFCDLQQHLTIAARDAPECQSCAHVVRFNLDSWGRPLSSHLEPLVYTGAHQGVPHFLLHLAAMMGKREQSVEWNQNSGFEPESNRLCRGYPNQWKDLAPWLCSRNVRRKSYLGRCCGGHRPGIRDTKISTNVLQ